MFGIKFLLRVIQFLFYAGVASLLIVVTWYFLSLLFRWVVDSIQNSNKDFAVWLRGKFNRGEAMPLLCRCHLHKWSGWHDPRDGFPNSNMQEKHCLRCGMIVRRLKTDR